MFDGFKVWVFLRIFEWGTISVGLHLYEIISGTPFGQGVSPYLYIFAYVFIFPFGIVSFIILAFMGLIKALEKNALVKMNPVMVLLVSTYFIFNYPNELDLQSLSFMGGYFIISFISVRVLVVSFGLKAGQPIGAKVKRKAQVRKKKR
jgi:hypothetical protein